MGFMEAWFRQKISSRDPVDAPEKTADEREEMKQRIAETAHKLFQDEGYATVSMRRLAKEVGCSPMTLYKYYDGKIAVLQTLWAVVFRDLFEEMRHRLKKEQNTRQKASAACLYYVNYWLDHPEHYRLVFMAEGVTQPEVSMFVDNPEIAGGFGTLTQIIAKAAGGSINDPGIKAKIDLVVSALHGIAHNKITISGYPWADAEVMIDNLINYLIGEAELET